MEIECIPLEPKNILFLDSKLIFKIRFKITFDKYRTNLSVMRAWDSNPGAAGW